MPVFVSACVWLSGPAPAPAPAVKQPKGVSKGREMSGWSKMTLAGAGWGVPLHERTGADRDLGFDICRPKEATRPVGAIVSAGRHLSLQLQDSGFSGFQELGLLFPRLCWRLMMDGVVFQAALLPALSCRIWSESHDRR